MSQEYVFDLLDRDVLTTADNDVLASAGNADEPGSIHHRPVAGREPAIWSEVLLGKAPTLHIACEKEGPAGVQVAFLPWRQRSAGLVAHGHLHPGIRLAVGVHTLFGWVARKHGRDCAVLGHPPGRDQPARQSAARLLGQRLRDGRTTADEDPERADVVFSQVRGAQRVGEKRCST